MKIHLSFFNILIICNSLFAQYKNIQISSPESKQPEEVAIAINPVNPLNIAVGANINHYYYSFDGSETWGGSRLSSAFGVWGDPSLTFDYLGNLYFAHLSNPQESGYWVDRIVVQKSADGGKSWDNGIGIGYNPPAKNQDKEWITSDMVSPMYKGNLYMAWTEFDKYGSTNPTDSSRILFSYSTDTGVSWSQPVKVSDKEGDCKDSDSTDEGAVPAVGPNGEIYLSWSGQSGIMFDKSTDGGKNFGRDIFVTSQPGGWDFNIPGIMRCNGMPVTLCDISNSVYRGNIYVNWSDQRKGTNNTNVYLIKSTDGGNTWGAVKQVNNDSTKAHQFFTWAAIDQSTGFLYFVFYDRRNHPNSLETDVYAAKSTDGGETFTNFKISESPFTPEEDIFFGDYNNIAAYNGKIYPVWTRLQDRILTIWTTVITESETSTKNKDMNYLEYELYQNYPNPFNPETKIRFTIPKAGYTSLKVFDLMGKEISLVDKWEESGDYTIKFFSENYPSGIYFYRLKSGEFEETRKMLVLK